MDDDMGSRCELPCAAKTDRHFSAESKYLQNTSHLQYQWVRLSSLVLPHPPFTETLCTMTF